jgi:cation diffusion facilitator family transporter
MVSVVAAGMNFATAKIMLRAARAHDSITLEADAKHLLTDVWTTVGIVAGLLVVMWRPEWSILDPLMAIAVAIQIVFTGIDLLRRSADALLDAALPPEELRTAEAAIRGALPPEADFHALRTRKAGSRRFLDLHLVVPGTMSVAESHALCDRVEAAIVAALANADATVHVEPRESAAPHR